MPSPSVPSATHPTITSSPSSVFSTSNIPNLVTQPPTSSTHPMITRSKVSTFKPKAYLTISEPKLVTAALAIPQWKVAMDIEYNALLKNHTWSLVSLPPGKKPIDCKWVYCIKENPNGSVEKYEARLVRKGFHQLPGFDFTKTFSPIIKPVTMRVILTLSLSFNWVIKQLDVDNAFLNGSISEDY